MTFLTDIMEKNNSNAPNGSTNVTHGLSLTMAIAPVLFGTEAALSFLANVMVVFLFIRRRHLLRNPHNRCILNLAITDILTSISVFISPSFALSENVYNLKGHTYKTRELYCRILWSVYLPYTFGAISLYTSVVLAFERWLAVRRSIFYKSRFKIFHMNILILVSWIIGLTAAIPIAATVEGIYDQSSSSCRFALTNYRKVASIILSTGTFLFQTVIPLTLITLAYIDVFRGIKTSLRFAASARAVNIDGIKRLKKVTKVSAITTFVLVVCWLPSTLRFYISIAVFGHTAHPLTPVMLFFNFLVFCNGCINPCIYVFSNPDLRHALKEIFCSY